MKKRMALTAAIAMAISVAGMLPASSATKLGAPVVTGETCARAGDTLQITTDDGAHDITIARNTTDLVVTGGVVCDADDTDLLGLAKVVIKGADSDDVDATFDLDQSAAPANFSALTFTVQVDGSLEFDATGLGALRPVVGTVSEESFSVGTLKGDYYAAELAFFGGDYNDVFDASGVVTTPVDLQGNDGNDVLKGGAEDDTLTDTTSSEGNNKLYGGAGNDTIDVDNGGDALSLVNLEGRDQAWGGAGDDDITADQADVVAPGDGDDALDFSSDDAVLQLNYSDSTAAISVDLDLEAGIVRSTAGDDYYDALTVVGSFVGSAFADTFVGSDASDDVFYGGEGADKLIGMDGADELWGGGGVDNIKGGLGADTISGDTGADKINGGGDDDTVYGGGGDDIMYGSTGDDVLKGAKGSDQAWGGKGRDDICSAEVTDGCEYKK